MPDDGTGEEKYEVWMSFLMCVETGVLSEFGKGLSIEEAALRAAEEAVRGRSAEVLPEAWYQSLTLIVQRMG